MHGANHTHPPAESHANPPVYRAYHDPDSAANLSTTVAHALAECMGVDVTDGSFRLYDSVDPDALDRLFRPRHDGTRRTGGALTFSVQGYRTTVHADGSIVIEPPAGGY